MTAVILVLTPVSCHLIGQVSKSCKNQLKMAIKKFYDWDKSKYEKGTATTTCHLQFNENKNQKHFVLLCTLAILLVK